MDKFNLKCELLHLEASMLDKLLDLPLEQREGARAMYEKTVKCIDKLIEELK